MVPPRNSRFGLGLKQLRMLLELEATNSSNVELSEQHMAIWCIGRVTACSSDCLGPGERNSGFLAWKHVEFHRGLEKGKFRLNLTIPNVRTSPRGRRDRRCVMLTPPKEHMVFSLAHRLLAIALRRGIIEDVSSLDELLSSDRFYVMIKRQHLNDPVFCAGIPGAATVNLSDPLPSASISNYLNQACHASGYTTDVSFYDIRKRAAMDLAAREGVANTREMLVIPDMPEAEFSSVAIPNEGIEAIPSNGLEYLETVTLFMESLLSSKEEGSG